MYIERKRFKSASGYGTIKKKTLSLPEKLIQDLEKVAWDSEISFNDLVGRVCLEYLHNRKARRS